MGAISMSIIDDKHYIKYSICLKAWKHKSKAIISLNYLKRKFLKVYMLEKN
jgi:hypothetical protein